MDRDEKNYKEITIEKVVQGGKGLSRDLQQVVFVPFTLPGEKVKVRVTRKQRDYMEADPVEIVEPSPERVRPDCRYYGRCGGCQLSHATYEAQLKIKTAILEETLTRARLSVPKPRVISGGAWNYRHRAQLKVDVARGELGFYERDSNRIVNIAECRCLTPALNALIPLLREALNATRLRGLSEIECYENDRGETVVFCNVPPASFAERLQGKTTVLGPDDTEQSALAWHFRDLEIPMRPDIFLQVNAHLWKQLVQEVEEHHEAGDKTAVELYCGAGFFTLPLSPRFRKIFACEESQAAIRFARSRYADTNITWICAPAENYRLPEEATVAILDPPRTGLHRKVTEKLLAHPLEKISYVSCDAPALARDLKMLSAAYRVQRMTLIDLFPQTHHFETVSLLVKN